MPLEHASRVDIALGRVWFSSPYEVIFVELRLLRRRQRWFVWIPLVVQMHTDDIYMHIPTLRLLLSPLQF